jgi:hypothetical protein
VRTAADWPAVAAFNLSSAAETVTKTMIAVLTLIAAVLVVWGLMRAWAARRRPQVVIEDIVPAEAIPSSKAPGLSAQLREAIRQALAQAAKDAPYAVAETLNKDVEGGLLRASGGVQVATITGGLRTTTEDSLDVLATGLRAVASNQADGLLAMLSSALPAQRGWTVRVFPVSRGTESPTEVGLIAELGPLGHPPDSVTTFWSGPPPAGPGESPTTGASLDRLLDPTAEWIATRLVSRQLIQSGPPTWWRLLSRAQPTNELAGLQRQLGAQLALYKMLKRPEFLRGFAQQALDDLDKAAQLLPEYYRPDVTMAAVHEGRGWSYRKSGELDRAADEFGIAVVYWTRALERLDKLPEADGAIRTAARERAVVRRAKCRLLSGDPGHLLMADVELAKLYELTAEKSLDLYNAACLFAIAIPYSAAASPEEQQRTMQAWILLGRALLADGAAGAWSRTMTDVELETLDRSLRMQFWVQLRTRHPSGKPLGRAAATDVVRQSMSVLGIRNE